MCFFWTPESINWCSCKKPGMFSREAEGCWVQVLPRRPGWGSLHHTVHRAWTTLYTETAPTQINLPSHKLTVCAQLVFVCQLNRVFSFLSLIKQVVTNCKNTVQGFKKFHGRAFSDPYVQSLKENMVYDIAQMPSGTTGIKVREEAGTFAL